MIIVLILVVYARLKNIKPKKRKDFRIIRKPGQKANRYFAARAANS
jgi:hypothetical protein